MRPTWARRQWEERARGGTDTLWQEAGKHRLCEPRLSWVEAKVRAGPGEGGPAGITNSKRLALWVPRARRRHGTCPLQAETDRHTQQFRSAPDLSGQQLEQLASPVSLGGGRVRGGEWAGHLHPPLSRGQAGGQPRCHFLQARGHLNSLCGDGRQHTPRGVRVLAAVLGDRPPFPSPMWAWKAPPRAFRPPSSGQAAAPVREAAGGGGGAGCGGGRKPSSPRFFGVQDIEDGVTWRVKGPGSQRGMQPGNAPP